MGERGVVGSSRSAQFINGDNNANNKLQEDARLQFNPNKNQNPVDDGRSLVDISAMQPYEKTTIDHIAEQSRLARLGLVTIEGTGYAVPGVFNAAIHDFTHPVSAVEKGGTALTIGVGMRVLLPKAGAGRAAAATAFTYFMVRDAVKPIANAYSAVWDTTDHRGVNVAAQKMGDGLGMFGWDAYWGMKLAAKGESLGERGLKATLGEKRFNAFEQTKADFLGSDKYFFGRHMNNMTKAIDRTTGNMSERLLGKKSTEPQLTFEQKVALAKEAQDHHIAVKSSATVHKHGLQTLDGKAVGLSETMDVLLSGHDPRTLTAPEVARISDAYNITQAPRRSLVPESAKPGEVKAPTDATAPAGTTGGAAPSDQLASYNAKNIAKLAGMAKEEMAKVPDQDAQVMDAVEGSVGPVYAAMNPRHKALDPGYGDWLGQMVALGSEVGGDAAKLQQVAPLFSRGRDAAIGQMTADLGPTGRNVHSMNIFSREMHTNLQRGMAKAGIPPEALASNNPPLNLVAFDGGAGPHTLPEINKVWDVDLIHWPRNMQELKMLRAGTNGHENMHNQYGGILKFDESIREQVIGETVSKALGAKATEMVDVPGHGQMSKQQLIVEILKAQANENTADMGGAAYTGPSGALSLGVLLQSLRKGGKLETRNVFGKELASAENPLGFEVHAIDTFRPKLVAEVLRQRGGNDPEILAFAKALDKYADEASNGGDYVWASLDNKGGKIVIPKAELEAVIPHLVHAQLNTPLKAFGGKTFADVLPDLPTQIKKTSAISDMMVDAIANKKPLESMPFSTQDYTMIQLQSAAMPTALRLVERGMDPRQVNIEVNRVSDFLEMQFHEKGDPHIDPLVPRMTTFKLMTEPRLLAQQTIKGIGKVIEAQPQIRSAMDRNLSVFSGYAGMQQGRKWFQDYRAGSTVEALLAASSQNSNLSNPTAAAAADTTAGDVPGNRKNGVPDRPPIFVTIPDSDQPAPPSIKPLEAPYLRLDKKHQVDINELRELQRTEEKLRLKTPQNQESAPRK